MSGHSKWSTIKHKKGALDAKRGKLFSKLVKEITVAAKRGGGEPAANPRLRLAIMKAKAASMPGKNIEGAIKKGSGDKTADAYFEVTYEGYGAEGVALLVECLTDNKNRSVAAVRALLSKNGGRLGAAGSVAWQFEKKAILRVAKNKPLNEEALMELALEVEAEDALVESTDYLFITTPKALSGLEEKLTAKNFKVTHAEVTQVPKNTVKLSKEKAAGLERLVELLEDLEDVQAVFSNHTSAE